MNPEQPQPQDTAPTPMPETPNVNVESTPQAPAQMPTSAPDPIATPVQNPAFMTAPQAPVQPAPKKKRLGLIIGLIVGGVVLLGTTIALLLFFLLPNGLVSESDLVSATTDDTTYLRPKQWESTNVNSISGYGNKRGNDDTSTALIAVQKKNYVQSGVKSASDSSVRSFREALMETMTSDAAEAAIKKTGVSCTSTENVTVKKSSVSTTNMIGVLKIDGICVRDDGRFKTIVYVTLGEDGYLRSIVMMATEAQWTQNEAVFTKMLESADQAD